MKSFSVVRITLLLLFVLTAVSSSLTAATFYVRPDGVYQADGTSWATATCSIQQGIKLAQAWDEVWVAAGGKCSVFLV